MQPQIPRSPRVTPGRAIAWFVLAAAIATCQPTSDQVGPQGGASRAEQPSVILVSIDTLRADRLGTYGHPRDTSPEIDAFARRAVLFEQTMAHAPSTLLSHAALFTSRWPQHHGASHIRNLPLSDRLTTLAEVFADAGYATAAFHAGAQLAPEFGLEQGFEVYDTVDRHRFAANVTAAFDWLDARDTTRPFFLFLHTYEVHHPYTPDAENLARFDEGYDGPLPDAISVDLLRRINAGVVPIDAADLAHIEATYAAEIRSMDTAFGELLRGLEARDLLTDAVLALTSDHGEEMGEHGDVGWHSITLYQEMLHVPWLLKLPEDRGAGRRVETVVASIDIAPTLLDVAGVEQPRGFNGRSVLPALDGPIEKRSIVAFWDEIDGTLHEALLEGRSKLHDAELYDLIDDPGEQRDLAAIEPERRDALRRRLEELTAADRAPSPPPPVSLDPETEERLRSLGYVQ
ncbi:MAG: sulfatase [Acidobacteriota bacterium]